MTDDHQTLLNGPRANGHMPILAGEVAERGRPTVDLPWIAREVLTAIVLLAVGYVGIMGIALAVMDR